MKKSFFTLLIAFLAINGFAQKVSYGLKGGFNLAKQIVKPGPFKADNLIGFHAGAIVDIDFGNVSIQPGLQYTVKGWQQKNELVNANQQSAGTSTDKFRYNYVELPINLLYNIKAADDTRVFAGGGPYIAYGVSGRATTYMGDYDVFDSATGVKRLDYGLGLTAGFQVNSFLIGINADLGFANLSPAANAKLKNSVLGFSVGYMFK